MNTLRTGQSTTKEAAFDGAAAVHGSKSKLHGYFSICTATTAISTAKTAAELDRSILVDSIWI